MTSKTTKEIGLKAVYKFHNETVHSFECFPSGSEASNEYFTIEKDPENHGFSGKMDGGVMMPPLKTSGPFAKLVTSVKVSAGLVPVPVLWILTQNAFYCSTAC